MLELQSLLRSVRKGEARHTRPQRPPDNCLTIRDVVKMRMQQDPDMNGVDATWLRIQLEAVINGQSAKIGPFDGVDGAWKDEPCFVLGASPGLRNAMNQGFRFDMLDGFHTIAVNHVIEDYPRAEWLLFLDKRFVDICKINLLRDYKGRMFAHIKARLEPSKRVTVFYTQGDGPSEHLVQGLFTFICSGLNAINLALISGANPIYLMGLDSGGQTDDTISTHYKTGYTGEVIKPGGIEKFKRRVPEILLRYAPYADRFRNVDPLGNITVFPKISVREIPELAGKFAT